jgi:cyclophilin family peptidyl-prolyl cis-trans isomerase
MGDPTATGRGNPGYRIPDELPASDYRYSKWVVAMANGGPNTGGSQFFIVLDDIDLDPDYTVLVLHLRLDALKPSLPYRSVSTPTPSNGQRLEALHIESVSIER